jgi:EAL domain-containing protein (putative c-di-GMP-specific phosphodiesterase class I)
VKVSVNTLPATIRDPEFQGQSLIQLLEQATITPDRIVIEITEKLLIDYLSLFQESLSYFTTLGMSLAVDDVGSGYSGLETISKLKPSYLKLVLHSSMICNPGPLTGKWSRQFSLPVRRAGAPAVNGRGSRSSRRR